MGSAPGARFGTQGARFSTQVPHPGSEPQVQHPGTRAPTSSNLTVSWKKTLVRAVGFGTQTAPRFSTRAPSTQVQHPGAQAPRFSTQVQHPARVGSAPMVQVLPAGSAPGQVQHLSPGSAPGPRFWPPGLGGGRDDLV